MAFHTTELNEAWVDTSWLGSAFKHWACYSSRCSLKDWLDHLVDGRCNKWKRVRLSVGSADALRSYTTVQFGCMRWRGGALFETAYTFHPTSVLASGVLARIIEREPSRAAVHRRLPDLPTRVVQRYQQPPNHRMPLREQTGILHLRGKEPEQA